MKPSEVLAAALDTLDYGTRWIKGRNAIDANGQGVSAISPKACGWCAIGAVCAVSPSYVLYDKSLHILRKTICQDAGRAISSWNDLEERTWSEVEELFHKAITAAKADEANSTEEGNQ